MVIWFCLKIGRKRGRILKKRRVCIKRWAELIRSLHTYVCIYM